MGLVYAEPELINGWELEASRRNLLTQKQVKSTTVKALVATGSLHLAINENIQEILQLPVQGKKNFTLGNGEIVSCDFVNNVEIRFKNRRCTANAFVLPGNSEPLLGTIPMEEMDVLVNPVRQDLTVNPEHPLYPVTKLK
ncbi:aspartyl protease family protein [Pseudobacter ginsenosidimutans]|jgi:clan AA aspartic protease|uniref:Clan AA aspartic protease n=1 Tax=Pseudobacter ginsenosidimutans TaxID=661488 RepID=A0A4Q7MX27_9BACT|nr:hypothetical protein [Pseudobacter ginsenosidimutans]QEC41583.1 hypothetical protein FSB84_07695 [Pseudobacter ginsenosidimutans]RZS71630.1 clan AA aspartic protease [Pseudobacter ginsenosidimutans]